MMDKEKRAKMLSDSESTVMYAAMLSNGMSCGNLGMNDKLYSEMVVGAFGLLSIVLNKAYEDISEIETNDSRTGVKIKESV